MAVIDGKYEVLSQRVLGEGQTLLSATAPDGAAINLIWFELSAEQETEFESYRQLLRRLKREGWAALREVVARPGATYAAWHVPDTQDRAKVPEELERLLGDYGYSSEQADLRPQPGAKPLIYALSFGSVLEQADAALTPLPEAPRRTKRAQGPPLWALRWGVGAALGALGMTLLYTSFLLNANNRLVSVPDLRGDNVNSAAQRLYDERLEVTLEAVASPEPPYEVVASRPAPGTSLRPGQRVRLSYALPAEQVALSEVPELRGQADIGEVQSQLEARGLRLGRVAFVPTNVAAGVVIAQSRAAATPLNEGSAVDILISEGLPGELSFVPNLTGLPLAEAEALVDLAELEVAAVEERPDSRAVPGTVLGQSLPPYTLVEAREAVLRLSVAGGGDSPAAPVPFLIGLSRAEAERVAVAAGYRVTVTETLTDAESLNLPEGVVNQTPEPGATGASGTTLTLLVNRRPLPVPRPAVTAELREPELREARYSFVVEAGIPTVEARVEATTLTGATFDVVRSRFVSGGERLSGSWATRAPGPVTFRLYLGSDNQPYQLTTDNP